MNKQSAEQGSSAKSGALAYAVIMYTTGPGCARCTLTKRVLASKGIAFSEVNIRDDEGARRYVTDELGYSEAPVVVVSDEDHWSGFRPDQIDRLASRALPQGSIGV